MAVVTLKAVVMRKLFKERFINSKSFSPLKLVPGDNNKPIMEINGLRQEEPSKK